jgi:hypothetical protein
MIDNPLEQTMGIFEHGRHKHAPADSPFAFEKIEDLWQEEIESDSTNSENDDEDGEQLGHGNQPNNAPNIEHDKPATSENTNADTCAQTTDRPEQHRPTHDQTNEIEQPWEDTEGQVDEYNRTTEVTYPRNNTEAPINNRETTQPARKRKAKAHNPQTRTSTRQIQKPKRFRDTADHTSPSNQPGENTSHIQPHHMHKRIRQSRDKMFFIRHRINDTDKHKWFLVQARPEASDPHKAQEEGIYMVRFWIREHQHSETRPQRNCRYWPEIHERNHNGPNIIGPIIPIRPGQVETLLTTRPDRYIAYELPVNLCTHAITGPFDFAVPKFYDQEANRVTFEDWEELKAKAPRHKIDVTDIDNIIPLR